MDSTFVDNSDNSDINSPEFGSDGKSKIRAISNADQALQISRKLEHNDMDRDMRRARVLGAFNGEAPYCDSDLINKAQAYHYYQEDLLEFQ